jgi:hypothetical protein
MRQIGKKKKHTQTNEKKGSVKLIQLFQRKLPIDITNMTESTLQYKNFMSNAPYRPSDASR